MRVALTYNQKRGESDESQEPPSSISNVQAEWDEAETIEAVISALRERHDVLPIEAGDGAFDILRRERPDIVFNIAEGAYGPCREGHIPSMLEYLNLPYTASDPLTLNICLDKARAKEILAFHGLPTARFRVVAEKSFSFNSLQYPLVVKPLYEGSSIGIMDNSLVLVEEYLPGREFTVAIIGNGEEARCLPIVEIKFDSLPSGVNPIYSFEAKWIWDDTKNPLEIFECPAKLSAELQAEIERICLQAYRILRCRDWCRIDVRLDANNRPHVLELNPLPGILPQPEQNSCLPKAARAAGMTYNQLINTVLDIGCKRYGIG